MCASSLQFLIAFDSFRITICRIVFPDKADIELESADASLIVVFSFVASVWSSSETGESVATRCDNVDVSKLKKGFDGK